MGRKRKRNKKSNAARSIKNNRSQNVSSSHRGRSNTNDSSSSSSTTMTSQNSTTSPTKTYTPSYGQGNYSTKVKGVLSFKEECLRKDLPYIINEELLVTMLEIFAPSGDEEEYIEWIIAYVEELEKNDKDSIYIIEQQKEKVTSHYSTDLIRNIYITKYPKAYSKEELATTIFPCIVAHTDEAHYTIKDRKIFKEVITPMSKLPKGDNRSLDRGNIVAYSKDVYGEYERCGLSADDKVGIYAGLHALVELPRVKLAFFASEEVGMVGSGIADLTFFDNCSFAIQLDRRSNTNLCTRTNGIDVASKEFEDLLLDICSPYGYHLDTGTATDVGELKHVGLEISAVNMSCGYKNEHTAREIINLDDMNTAVTLALKVCTEGLINLPEEDQTRYLHDGYSTRYLPKTESSTIKWNDHYQNGDYEDVEERAFGNPYSTTDYIDFNDIDEDEENSSAIYSSISFKKQSDSDAKKSKGETLKQEAYRTFVSDTPILYPDNINLTALETNISLIDDEYFNVLLSAHLQKRSDNLNSVNLAKLDKILSREVTRRNIMNNNF